MSATLTTITWPPARETHIVTVIVQGTTVSIPANQTTSFSNSSLPTTTTKPPPTTILGALPPPPYVSGSPTSTSSNAGDGPSTGVVWRNLGLVVLGIVVLAAIGSVVLKRYRSGQAKKQEPRNFTQVGEDDGESERGRRTADGSTSDLPGTGAGGSSISLATLGGLHHPSQVAVAVAGSSVSSNVRERRNSQPIPRTLDLGGNLRS